MLAEYLLCARHSCRCLHEASILSKISLWRSALPTSICNLTSMVYSGAWGSFTSRGRSSCITSRDRSSTAQALPEGPLPTQGGGGGAPALPIFLSLHLLLSQRRGDVSCLVALVGEVLVKRHCWFRLTVGRPPRRHVILLHVGQLPMGQVGFRVAPPPWGERTSAERVCRASNKIPKARIQYGGCG